MRHHVSRAGACALAITLVGLAAAPASAAATVARASASAAVVTVGGTPTDSGTYTVTNDGTRETTTGSNRPVVSALIGQPLVSAGVLAQDATTQTSGRSAACAGLAGDGAGVVAVGDGQCLTPGGTLALSAGTLDLSHLQIVQSTVLQGLDQQVQTALQPVLDPVVAGLQAGLQTGLRQLGDPGLFVGLGAVQSRCTAAPGTADGSATLADVGAYAQVGGRRVDLLALPVNPAPNTKVTTDLSDVALAVEDALRSQLSNALDGSLGALGAAVDRAAVLNNVVANIGSQLGPLDANVLSGTLNKQVRPSAGSIEVTALDLDVLPAAATSGPKPLALQLGRSTCGPNDRIAPVARPRPAAPPKAPAQPPTLPRRVTAGLAHGDAGADQGSDHGRLVLALGGLLVLATGAGALDFRRHLGRRHG
jgi:hypothetical protein